MEEKRKQKLIELRKHLIKTRNDHTINTLIAQNYFDLEELKKEHERIARLNLDIMDLAIAVIKYALDSKEQ